MITKKFFALFCALAIGSLLFCTNPLMAQDSGSRTQTKSQTRSSTQSGTLTRTRTMSGDQSGTLNRYVGSNSNQSKQQKQTRQSGKQ